MIEVSALSVSINKCPILRGVSFTASAGQITAIVGPNGSGKSTLLKALCGDYRYTGQAYLDGRDLTKFKPLEAARLRAVLPQSSSLPFPFTVREVVAMGVTAGHPGVSKALLAQLPEMALEEVDLPGFGGRYYGDLSGGEQQRVQLARVLCQVWVPVLDGVPRYLFLDEPVSALDIKHQLSVMDVARRFADAGGGVITVMHDLNLTSMYADRVIALRAGEVVAHGKPAAVLTDAVIRSVFEAPLRVGVTPHPEIQFVLPQSVLKSPAFASSKVA
jgi:iron complex transport system ATP-binding protein